MYRFPVSILDRSLLPLAVLAFARFALHLATSDGYGFFRDEFYYLACSDRLAWGYVDHPPLSIALLSLSRRVLGDSLIAIRFLPAVAAAATVFVAGLIARELGGGRRAEILAGLSILVVPVYLAMGHFFSMNVFDVLVWALLGWIVVHIFMRDDQRWWLAFGVVAGLGLLNKLSVAFLGFGIVVGLVFSSGRRHFASPWIWLGGLIALVLIAPHLVWQLQHGWPTLEFQAQARAEKNLELSLLEFAGQQVLMANPVLLPIWLTGIAGLLWSPRLSRFRPLGIAYLAIFLLLVSMTGKAYYLAPIYTIVLAAGAVMIEPGLERRRWMLPVIAVVVLVAGGVLLPMTIPVLSQEAMVSYSRSLGIEASPGERHERAELPQIFADMHGWVELVDAVASAADLLTREERERAVVLASNYGEAGAIEFLGRGKALPPVASGHNNFWFWRPEHLDGPVIVVRRSREELLGWFESVELVGKVQCRWCMPYQNDVPIHLARGLRIPVDQFWLEQKRFM